MDVLVQNIGRREAVDAGEPSRNVSAETSLDGLAEARVDDPAPTFLQKRADALVAIGKLAIEAEDDTLGNQTLT